MASPSSKYLDIIVNYDGVFNRPIDYTAGLTKTERVLFDDVDYDSYITWLKESTGHSKFTVYYVVPGKDMCGGLRMLKCDEDLKAFVEHGLKGNGKISIYLDLYEDDLTDFLGEDRVTDDPIRVDKGKGKQVVEESTDPVRDDDLSDESLDLGEEDLHVLHKFKQTEEDIFLNKLCIPKEKKVNVDNNQEDNDGQDDEQVRVDEVESSDDVNKTVRRGVVYPIFDLDMEWKLMKCVLGLKFENVAQLRHCLTCLCSGK